MSTYRPSQIQVPDIVVQRIVDRDGTQRLKRYRRGRKLGEGGFAVCYELQSLQSNRIYAAKVIDRRKMERKNLRIKLLSEIRIHKFVSRHKHVVGFERWFETPEFIYILLELCPHQTLMELVARRKRLTEPEVQYLLLQLLSGVRYLHAQNVIHRDLKLGNIFIGQSLNLKLGDFGLATRLQSKGERKRTLCGTPNYIAPEILDKHPAGHSFEVDVWSIGCILYTLLVGTPPFETRDIKLTYRKIKHGHFEFPRHVPVSFEAKRLIKHILNPNPTKRPTMDQIRMDAFFSKSPPPRHITIDFLHRTPTKLKLMQPLDAHQQQEQQQRQNAPRKVGEKPPLSQNRQRDMIDEVTRKLEGVHLGFGGSKKPHQRANTPPLAEITNQATATTNGTAPPQAKASTLNYQPHGQFSAAGSHQRMPSENSENVHRVSVPARPRKNVLLSPKFGKPSRLRAAPAQFACRTAEEPPPTAATSGSSAAGSQAAHQAAAPVSSQGHHPSSQSGQHSGGHPEDQSRRSSDDKQVNTLRNIHVQIEQSFVAKRTKKKVAAPTASGDGATFSPPIWVLTWCDYSEKYGMGYILSNGSAGVYYNDASKLITCRKRERLDYIEHIPDGDPTTGARERRTCYTTDNYPRGDTDFSKKVTLLRHFEQFLNKDRERDACEPTRLADTLPYVQRWYNTQKAKLFALSNQTVQVNFNDKSEVIVTPGTPYMVTYTDKEGRQTSSTWDAALKHEQPDLAKRLRYASNLMKMLLDSIERDAGHGVPSTGHGAPSTGHS